MLHSTARRNSVILNGIENLARRTMFAELPLTWPTRTTLLFELFSE